MQKSKWIAIDDMDPGEQERRQKTQKYMEDEVAHNLVSVERMRLRTFLVDMNSESSNQSGEEDFKKETTQQQ